MTVRAACSSGGLEPGPVLPALCNLHMSLLHLLSGITFFQGEIQPDQPKYDGNVPGSSTGMLRFVGIDNMLVNKRRILLCNRITLEVGISLPAFARSIKSFRWIKMPFRKYTPAAGAGDHPRLPAHGNLKVVLSEKRWHCVRQEREVSSVSPRQLPDPCSFPGSPPHHTRGSFQYRFSGHLQNESCPRSFHRSCSRCIAADAQGEESYRQRGFPVGTQPISHHLNHTFDRFFTVDFGKTAFRYLSALHP